MSKQKVNIELNNYHHKCGDGCCDDYGTEVKVDGVVMPFNNQDTETIIQQILNHLGYEVKIVTLHNGEE